MTIKRVRKSLVVIIVIVFLIIGLDSFNINFESDKYLAEMKEKLENNKQYNRDTVLNPNTGEYIYLRDNNVYNEINEKIQYENIVLSILSIDTSDNRIRVNYKIENAEGNAIEAYSLVEDTSELILKDTSSLFFNTEDAPFKITKNGETLTPDLQEYTNLAEGSVSLIFYDKIDYPVTLEINIDKIGKIEGIWQYKINLDLQ